MISKLTPGDSYTLEWGLSKSVRQTVDIGVIGYYQQQINNDRGAGVRRLLRRVHIILAFTTAWLAWGRKSICSVRRWAFSSRLATRGEFAAEDPPEGNAFVLTLTKRF